MPSSPIGDLAERYWAAKLETEPETTPRIHVDEVASQVAAFYEKARSVVDYQEEHLLRKHFIARALRRRLALQKKDAAAEPLIKDIVRAGHLPNDSVPETKIAEVQRLIDAYRNLARSLKDNKHLTRETGEWLFRITASAIEELLFPPILDEPLAEFMLATLRGHLTVHHREGLTDDEISVQLFIAVQRALLRVDADQLHHHLLQFVYPDWTGVADPIRSAEIAEALPRVRSMIRDHIADPRGVSFLALASHYNTVFRLLGDVIAASESPGDLERAMRDVQELEPRVRTAYQKRFAKERSRLNKFAFLSVTSFFVSKIAVALAVEIPIERYLTHSFSMTTTVVNILFPPLLMLVIVLAIRMPSPKNKARVLEEVEKVAFGKPQSYAVTLPRRSGGFGGVVVRLFYGAIFLLVIAGIANALTAMRFNIPNIVIFVIFSSLVAATGVRVHNRARGLSLEIRRSTLLSFLADLVVMPFVTIGTWIIRALSRFNIVVVLFNAFVDFPFQAFVEFIESVRDFIKGKKEAVR